VRGDRRKATIKEIIYNPQDVVWKYDRPYFVVVETADGDLVLANPAQLDRNHR
jgi:hypothetical protein